MDRGSEKMWQLITGEPSCDCGWLCVCVFVCVTGMHKQHSQWLINVMVLAFTCTPGSIPLSFLLQPKMPSADWRYSASLRAGGVMQRWAFHFPPSLCNMEFHPSVHHIPLKTQRICIYFTYSPDAHLGLHSILPYNHIKNRININFDSSSHIHCLDLPYSEDQRHFLQWNEHFYFYEYDTLFFSFHRLMWVNEW